MSEKRKKVPFEERQKHFAKEKLFLADRFGEFLIERIKFHQGNVILLIDAGTTLSPFFKVINKLISKEKGEWVDRFIVVTNNLAASDGWFSQESPDLCFKCVFLSGKLVSEYSALVGFEGKIFGDLNGMLEQLKAYKQVDIIRSHRAEFSKVKIISLVTGNWIRVRRELNPIPLPLARGSGHMRVKTRMMWASDEIYVIAPLGKIFSGVSERVLVNLFKRKMTGDPYREYKTNELESKQNKVEEKIKLVSTYRPTTDFVLSKSQDNIKDLLKDKLVKVCDNNYSKELRDFEYYNNHTDIPHYMFQFDDVSANEIEQLKEELPHRYCQDVDFLTKFHIPKNEATRLKLKLSGYKDYKKLFEMD